VARFGLVGLAAAGVQLLLLRLLLDAGAASLPANAAAFFAAANLNFALSGAFTWSDREATDSVLARWSRYFVAIAGTAFLNMATFAVASPVIGDLPGAALGLGVAALANFVTADRLVFTSNRGRTTAPAAVRS
jgi:putative flippase GtrA